MHPISVGACHIFLICMEDICSVLFDFIGNCKKRGLPLQSRRYGQCT